MTIREAIIEARKRWGEWGYVWDLSNRWYERYLVGYYNESSQICKCGEGESLDRAFEDADRKAKEKELKQP